MLKGYRWNGNPWLLNVCLGIRMVLEIMLGPAEVDPMEEVGAQPLQKNSLGMLYLPSLSREKHGVSNPMDTLKQHMLGWGNYSKSLRFTYIY